MLIESLANPCGFILIDKRQAKIAFEKYFLHKVRSGAGEPAYERLMMKVLGIDRLRPEQGEPRPPDRAA